MNLPSLFKPNSSNNDVLNGSQVWTKPVCITLLLLVISMVVFIVFKSHGNWAFVLELRGKKLLALMVVGYALGVSTLLFQTLTQNPILTPSLLGFDALYILIQSIIVFFLGTINIFNTQPVLKFAIEVAIMMGASLLLFRLLFTRNHHDLARLILVGIIFGVLFRSLSSLVARLISPEDYVVVQASSFAQFNTINLDLLVVSLVVCLFSAIVLWRWRYQMDILMLGREAAINLGINYQQFSLKLLVLIAILVATATAFVGPVVFLGLLVCAITNRICRRMYHSERLVLVSLVAMLCLVLGQTVFEQILGLTGVLSAVIEVCGGLLFLVLIFTQYRRNIKMA
ncbi:iron chelate uptake ABC transporter family permease subunit [Neisseria montereyensis]|uniref:Iron chelate uptake ABC transporter family permease subunit n=1 Tax=Neisseria montereyensis TaxID=2973938 RepID=A0ABT2FBM8_9NEIS|nr:iron chelate uptake ABC transporter family permease subunit [Neisseria montereyensis]MCS4533371.1 iron chelate uptake ABC transporter family permease subunit [Neisseria montereyensis]